MIDSGRLVDAEDPGTTLSPRHRLPGVPVVEASFPACRAKLEFGQKATSMALPAPLRGSLDEPGGRCEDQQNVRRGEKMESIRAVSRTSSQTAEAIPWVNRGGRSDPRRSERIVDYGRWAPSGNVQCWDVIVVDEPWVRDGRWPFMRQAQRLVDHAKGFPAVKEDVSGQHVAIDCSCSNDPRWKSCFRRRQAPVGIQNIAPTTKRFPVLARRRDHRTSSSAVAAEGLTSMAVGQRRRLRTCTNSSALLGYHHPG